jgi:hypothetical protein
MVLSLFLFVFIPIFCASLAIIHLTRLYKQHGANIGELPDRFMQCFWGTFFAIGAVMYILTAYLIGTFISSLFE